MSELNPYHPTQVVPKQSGLRHRPNRALTIVATIFTLGCMLATMFFQSYSRAIFVDFEVVLPMMTQVWLTPIPLVAYSLLLSFIILKEVMIEAWPARRRWNFLLILAVFGLTIMGFIFLTLPIMTLLSALQ